MARPIVAAVHTHKKSQSVKLPARFHSVTRRHSIRRLSCEPPLTIKNRNENNMQRHAAGPRKQTYAVELFFFSKHSAVSMLF